MKTIGKTLVVMLFVLLSFGTTSEAAKKAPNNLSYYNGHYYYVYQVRDTTTWLTCKSRCEQVGGHLATITSAEENAFVYSLIKTPYRFRAFFGLYNAGTPAKPNWTWVTGEPVTYTNWYEDEPSYYDGMIEEKYVQFFNIDSTWAGKWNDGTGDTSDYDGNDLVYYICEWESNPNAVQNVVKDIEDQANDNDLSMSEFEPLQAKITKCTNNSLTLTWKKNPYANGYMIYGNKCGKKNRYKYICTVKASKNKYVMKKLKKGTYYKFFVVSIKNVGANKNILSVSKTVHATTTGGKYGNAKAVKLEKIGNLKKGLQNVSMLAGRSATIKAKSVKKDKKIRNHRGLAFESNDTYVAEVSTKGTITAKHSGTCKIYVYAQNGVSKVIKLTVY